MVILKQLLKALVERLFIYAVFALLFNFLFHFLVLFVSIFRVLCIHLLSSLCFIFSHICPSVLSSSFHCEHESFENSVLSTQN